MPLVRRGVLLLIFMMGCGRGHPPLFSLERDHTEWRVAVRCQERAAQKAIRFRDGLLSLEGSCPPESLLGSRLKLKTPPPEVVLIPECDNNLLHIVSTQDPLNRVISIAGDGSFSREIPLTLEFVPPWTGAESRQDCLSLFDVSISGQVRCRSSDSGGLEEVRIESVWRERPDSSRPECPSLRGCSAVTQELVIACD